MRIPIGVIFLLIPSLGIAKTPTAANFLEIVPSVRSFSTAGNTALLVGAESLGANPAGLIGMDRKASVFTTFHQPIEGASYAHLAFAKGFSALAIGASATLFRLEAGDTTDEFGAPTNGDSSAQDAALALGLAGRLPWKFQWGATVRATRSELAGFTSNTSIGGDLGLMGKLGPAQLSFGVNNLGQGIKFISETSPLPTRLVFDAAIPFSIASLMAGIQRDLHNEIDRFSLGAEAAVGPLMFRGGYAVESEERVSAQSSGLDNLYFGMGAKIGSLILDYGVGPGAGEEKYTHRFGLSGAW